MRFIVGEISASEMIPIRLLISISIISMISFFVVNGVILSNHIHNEGCFEKTLKQIGQNIELLVMTGSPRNVMDGGSPGGTKQVHSLTIPSEISEISFGINGDTDEVWFSKQKSSGLYYYSQQTGDNIIWIDDSCLFVKGVYSDDRWIPCWNNSIFSIHQKGKCMITFELISVEDQLYVLVYDQNDVL